jgi:hypothetical protein
MTSTISGEPGPERENAAGTPATTAPPAEQAEVLRGYYRQMALIRAFELRAAEMYTRARIGGYCHLNLGEPRPARDGRDRTPLMTRADAPTHGGCAGAGRETAHPRTRSDRREAWTGNARAHHMRS